MQKLKAQGTSVSIQPPMGCEFAAIMELEDKGLFQRRRLTLPINTVRRR
jgi:hypothetical protein